MTDLKEIIPFIIPLVLLQLGLQAYSIVDLVRRRRVRFNNKLIWGVVIVGLSMIGAVAYLVFRGDDE